MTIISYKNYLQLIMKFIIFLLLTLLLTSCDSTYSEFVVETHEKNDTTNLQIISFDVDRQTIWKFSIKKPESYFDTTILSCEALPWKDKKRVTVECRGHESNLKTQILIDCNLYNSKNQAYFFIGKEGMSFANKNFYFYCK